MDITFFLFLILINSFIFLNLNHPLMMGLSLMIQTLLTTLNTGFMSETFWFSYSLFLIFMGGMLVLVMYMTSLAFNELFSFSFNKQKILFMLIFFSLILFLLFLDKSKNTFNFLNKENIIFFSMKILEKENNFLTVKMFNFPTNFIMLMLVMYMFLTLIMTVKISNIFKGPIRSKN